jgi:hypothetical protein
MKTRIKHRQSQLGIGKRIRDCSLGKTRRGRKARRPFQRPICRVEKSIAENPPIHLWDPCLNKTKEIHQKIDGNPCASLGRMKEREQDRHDAKPGVNL